MRFARIYIIHLLSYDVIHYLIYDIIYLCTVYISMEVDTRNFELAIEVTIAQLV